MYLIMKGENKQNVYVKEIQKNRVKRAEKQKTGIDKEKSESVPVFCCLFLAVLLPGSVSDDVCLSDTL